MLQIFGLRMQIQGAKYRGNLEILKLGSDYGGWSLVSHPSLFNGLVISAGAGEDISFDVEIVNFFNAKVVLVDPTLPELSIITLKLSPALAWLVRVPTIRVVVRSQRPMS